ncbi:uncharacterized protein [Rutidosis leptorrhynchoides]|uniref:uncharacterized protein n=1 Tax=Rutidosis leptorrhynchoides TaxID=125765 RepID=UPI003A99C92F
MAQINQTSTCGLDKKSYVFLHQLELGKEAAVKVMICRSWDTHTAYGKYLSTDFISSDEQGNVIQLTAKSNVSHHFIPRLNAGCVYLLSHFDVIPNREEYRVLKDNKLMIQLHGSTFLRKQPAAEAASFIRHPFSCIEIEHLEATDGKYLVGGEQSERHYGETWARLL